jgi:hypothetical protein
MTPVDGPCASTKEQRWKYHGPRDNDGRRECVSACGDEEVVVEEQKCLCLCLRDNEMGIV